MFKLSLLAWFLLAMCMSNASAVSLYKWTDAEGHVSYQDRPPPAGQDFEEKSFAGDIPATQTAAPSGQAQAVAFYVSSACRECGSVRTILEMNRIPYQELSIETDASARQTLIDLLGSAAVPSVIIGDQAVEPLDRITLERALKQGGHQKPPLIEE